MLGPDLTFPDNRGEREPPVAIGSHIDEQLVQLAPSLRFLKELRLNLHYTEAGRPALYRLTRAPAFPQLRCISLEEMNVDFKDWINLVAKHRATIVKVELRHVRMDSQSFDEIRQGFSRLRACSKLRWMTFLLSYVSTWDEMATKQLNIPTCREFHDDGFGGPLYRYITHEGDEDDGTDDDRLEGWMAVDTIIDGYRVGDEEYVQESLLGFIECFGGLPWAD